MNLPSREGYLARLAATARSVLAGGATSLEDVCRGSEGAPPELIQLGLAEVFPIREPESGPQAPIECGRIPEPHPADFDWRFSPASTDYIVDQLTGGPEPVLCLGTPSVFCRLLAKGQEATLVDRNPLLSATLPPGADFICLDLDRATLTLPRRYPVVIADPPWYPASYRNWLGAVRSSVSSGATLHLMSFGPLTRPTAEAELTQLRLWLARFAKVSTGDRPIEYDTPRFEQETFDRIGLPPMPRWRLGTLLTARLRGEVPAFACSEPVGPAPTEWRRFLLGSQVVLVRTSDAPDRGPLHLSSIYADGSFVLRSVSRRHKERALIDLWTSRNRVARLVSGRSTLFGLLEAWEEDWPTVGNAADDANILAALIGV